jgi:hypothetical protein
MIPILQGNQEPHKIKSNDADRLGKNIDAHTPLLEY